MKNKENFGTFISPLLSDTGFKILFGQTKNKSLLIDLLNTLFRGKYKIEDLQYLDKEQVRRVKTRKTIIYDIHCRTSTNEYIIVEMQYKKHKNFFPRTLVYVAEALARQAVKDKDEYDISAVYGVYLMNFEDDICNELLNDFTLMNERTYSEATDLIRMLFLSIPLFKKEENECKSRLDKWIYILKNMENLNAIPWIKNDPIFSKLAKEGAIANLSEAQYRKYRREIDAIKVMKGAFKVEREDGFEKGEAFGRKKGRAEGLEEGRAEGEAIGMKKKAIETAKKLKAMKLTISQIAQATGLTEEEILDS